MVSQRVPVLLVVVAALSGAFAQKFDGVVRPTPDGRYEAYMIPPAAANHASFLELLPDGELLLAWFAGTAEGANNCSIVLAHLPPKSTQWSEASLVSRRDGYSNQNPVLFLDPTGQVVYLFHSQQPAASALSGAEAEANIWMLQSFDRGLNWTKPLDLFTKKGSFDRNRIIYSLDGDWILPMYYAVDGDVNEFSAMQISSDQKTWTQYNMSKSNYLVQPSVIRPKVGVAFLQAYLRDRRAQFIYSSNSTDEGRTWSAPVSTGLPNNNAAIQSHVLNNGHIVLVYNPTTSARVPLRISLSEDEGQTWAYSRDLETNNTLPITEYSYPCIVQSPDDYIHISYTYDRLTIKYVKFKEDWIMNSSLPLL